MDQAVYGTGAERILTPNVWEWVASFPIVTDDTASPDFPYGAGNPTPGSGFVTYLVDQLLPLFEAWLSSQYLPPVFPWDGTQPQPWTGGVNTVTVPASLGVGFPGITSEADLAAALWSHYIAICAAAPELGEPSPAAGMGIQVRGGYHRYLEHAPYSHRFWSYLKWAQGVVRQYRGEVVVPPAELLDHDGVPLSSKRFFDVMNPAHRFWHLGSTNASGLTPGWGSGFGQLRLHLTSDPSGAIPGSYIHVDFLRFHGDLLRFVERWQRRRGETPTAGWNSTDGRPRSPTRPTLAALPVAPGDHDWTADSGGVPRSPSAWQESDTSWHPWPNSPAAAGTWPPSAPLVTAVGSIGTGTASPTGFRTTADNQPVTFARVGNLSVLGWMMNFPVHNATWRGRIHPWGHWRGPDFMSHESNNYSDRFRQYHGWIDNVWRWRQPRLSAWDTTTHQWTRHFAPALAAGPGIDGPWPGFDIHDVAGIVIVRSPTGGADTLWPADAIAGWDPATGAGSLRVRLRVADTWGRAIQVQLVARVYAAGSDPDAAGAAVATSATDTFVVGPGGVAALDADVFRSLALSTGLASSNPGGAPPTAVGFVNRLVRITATLTVADGSDPGWVATDRLDIDLVREAQPPVVSQVLVSPAAFVRSRVQADLTANGGTVTYPAAIRLVIQDQTSDAFTPTWPPDTIPELLPLLRRRPPASGLFDTAVGMPTVTLSAAGVTVTPSGSPVPEDPSHPSTLPQRYECSYDVTFTSVAAFGATPGAQVSVPVSFDTFDRSQNHGSASAVLQLVQDANPRMDDGATPWLSADTRVFKLYASQSRFGSAPGSDPVQYIRDVLTALNSAAPPADTFEALPDAQSASALDYERQGTNPDNGLVENVYNFALAKVRVANTGSAAAERVRAFFRLFSYTSANLLFDEARGYRAWVDPTPDGTGHHRIVPLYGYDGGSPGDDTVSVPFFATARVATGAATTTQTDEPNVRSFGPGTRIDGGDLVLYFGVWLDINQDEARFPLTLPSGGADGPFAALGGLVPFRSLVLDAHQCMVVELRYDGDPTPAGASPGAHDNLAQRNLVILNPENPGAAVTREVEHSFLLDTRGRRADPEAARHRRHQLAALEALAEAAIARVAAASVDGHEGHGAHDHGAHDHGAHDHGAHDHGAHDHGATTCDEAGCAVKLPEVRGTYESALRVPAFALRPAVEAGVLAPTGRPAWLSAPQRDRKVRDRAVGLAMAHVGSMHDAFVEPFVQLAHAAVDLEHPFVFDGARWLDTARGVDELVFHWGDLPREAEVELFLPRLNAEDVLNYRNLRHAPPTVRIVDSHRLRLFPVGPTWLPLPSAADPRIVGTLTVRLPDGIRVGQQWRVDVQQVRGGRQVVGEFHLLIRPEKAPALWRAERDLLVRLHRQLAHRPVASPWHPVLQRRLALTRARAQALAEAAGVPWVDPTTWGDPTAPTAPGEPPRGGTLAGREVRVVLERIEVVDDRDPWFKGKGEVHFACRVATTDNGGKVQHTRIPERGVVRVGSGGDVLAGEVEIFRGWVDRSLELAVVGTERDSLDPDDPLGRYTRRFCGGVADWPGRYGPTGAGLDPEDVGAWRLWYRIENA